MGERSCLVNSQCGTQFLSQLRFINSQLPHWRQCMSRSHRDVSKEIKLDHNRGVWRANMMQLGEFMTVGWDVSWWCLIVTIGFFRILETGNVEGIYMFILFSNYKELENLKSSVGVFVGFSKRLPPWKLTYLPKMDGSWKMILSFCFFFLCFGPFSGA